VKDKIYPSPYFICLTEKFPIDKNDKNNYNKEKRKRKEAYSMYILMKDFVTAYNIHPSFVPNYCICSKCEKTIPSEKAYVNCDDSKPYCENCIDKTEKRNICYVSVMRLAEFLSSLYIPYNIQEYKIFHGYIITFPWTVGDIACHQGTYGGREGLFESYGFSTDEGDVTGNMNIVQALEKILFEYNHLDKKGN
jgi:hypothetical protein